MSLFSSLVGDDTPVKSELFSTPVAVNTELVEKEKKLRSEVVRAVELKEQKQKEKELNDEAKVCGDCFVVHVIYSIVSFLFFFFIRFFFLFFFLFFSFSFTLFLINRE